MLAWGLVACRGDWLLLFPALALVSPAALGRGRAAAAKQPAAKPGPPHPAWGLVIAALLAVGVLYPLGRLAYEGEEPRVNADARSPLPWWTEPLRNGSWLVRQQAAVSGEEDGALETLESIADQWVRLAPHDEFAWNLAVLVAEADGGPGAAAEVASEAWRRLPWSDVMILHATNSLVDDGRPDAAWEFLRQARARRGGVFSPVLNYRAREVQQLLPAGTEGSNAARD